MKINKYKFKDSEVILLVYGNIDMPIDNMNLELVEKNINLIESTENHLFPIFRDEDLMSRANPLLKNKRVRDIVLSEEGINSFYDLQCAYNLLRNYSLNKSTRVRKFVEDKYSEIINIEYDEKENQDKTLS